MKISYKDVESHCNELHAVATDINRLLNDVKEIRKKIIAKEIWVGKAADYYLENLANLEKNFEGVTNEIENAILFMANSAGSYEMIDKTIMQEICSNLNIAEPTLSKSKIFMGD